MKKKPRIFINIEGGLIQSVVSDFPCDIVKIDYDTEGATAEDGVLDFDQDDGTTSEAFISMGSATVDAAEVDRVFKAAESALNSVNQE